MLDLLNRFLYSSFQINGNRAEICVRSKCLLLLVAVNYPPLKFDDFHDFNSFISFRFRDNIISIQSIITSQYTLILCDFCTVAQPSCY